MPFIFYDASNQNNISSVALIFRKKFLSIPGTLPLRIWVDKGNHKFLTWLSRSEKTSVRETQAKIWRLTRASDKSSEKKTWNSATNMKNQEIRFWWQLDSWDRRSKRGEIESYPWKLSKHDVRIKKMQLLTHIVLSKESISFCIDTWIRFLNLIKFPSLVSKWLKNWSSLFDKIVFTTVPSVSKVVITAFEAKYWLFCAWRFANQEINKIYEITWVRIWNFDDYISQRHNSNQLLSFLSWYPCSQQN